MRKVENSRSMLMEASLKMFLVSSVFQDRTSSLNNLSFLLNKGKTILHFSGYTKVLYEY
jgi:hypothetical protein